MKKNNFKNKIAVVQLWPELKNAESEVTERIRKSAKNIGVETVVIDPRGICVKTKKKITHEDVDFAIHLHFYTPKSYDIFSFVALWNPIDFFHEWGYRHYSRNLMSHDDFLSCDSYVADDHVIRMSRTGTGHLPPHFKLYHSLSDPVIKPRVMKRKLFYIGINWEKLGKSNKSRHDGLLLELDKTDKLAIYGPKKFQGIDVWGDFDSYVDEIPFDGVSIIEEISKVGVGLVFSSQAHINSALMSNRLFETLAAGAVAICDENPFAKRFFGDSVLFVDSKSPTLTQDVLAHLSWLNENPEKAKALAEKAQRKFEKSFLMDHSLMTLYKHLPSRKHELGNGIAKNKKSPLVGTIFIFIDNKERDLDNFVQLTHNQNYPNQSIVCFYDSDTNLDNFQSKIDIDKDKKVTWIATEDLREKAALNLGLLVHMGLESLTTTSPKTAYVNVMTSNEHIYHDHITSLVNLAVSNPHLRYFASSAIILNLDLNEHYYHIQDHTNRLEYDPMQPTAFSRFLFEIGMFTARTAYNLPYLNHRFSSVITHGSHVPVCQKVTCEIAIDEEFYTKVTDSLRLEDEIITDVTGHHFHRPTGWELEQYGLPPTFRRRVLVKIKNKVIKYKLNPTIRRIMRDIYWVLLK